MTFDISLLSILKTTSQILTAGVAITAFSLFLYASAFNLKDRVARAFILILFFVGVIYTSEAIAQVKVGWNCFSTCYIFVVL
jgi:hypothetical protein